MCCSSENIWSSCVLLCSSTHYSGGSVLDGADKTCRRWRRRRRGRLHWQVVLMTLLDGDISLLPPSLHFCSYLLGVGLVAIREPRVAQHLLDRESLRGVLRQHRVHQTLEFWTEGERRILNIAPELFWLVNQFIVELLILLYTRQYERRMARDKAKEHHCDGKQIDCRSIVSHLLDHFWSLKVQIPKLRSVKAWTNATLDSGSAFRRARKTEANNLNCVRGILNHDVIQTKLPMRKAIVVDVL